MSEIDVLTNRMQRCEEELKEHRENTRQIFDLLREVREEQIRSSEALKAHGKCPQPGLCERLEARIVPLETARNQAIGGWKLIMASAAISSFCAALIAYFGMR
jgi:hypothetical protein